jgi:hypothetical protein
MIKIVLIAIDYSQVTVEQVDQLAESGVFGIGSYGL